MHIKQVSLDIVCGVTSQIPMTEMPELAFAGKSNVGKSSLINVIMNRKSLARTSSQPGKTQTINFYNVNDTFYLVDLPGYGYAAASAQAREAWGRMIENYLHQSRMLRAIFLLVDIRHAPSSNDKMMYDWIVQGGFRPVIIATKLDKIKRSQVQKQIRQIRQTLGAGNDCPVLPFSAQSRAGKEEIYAVMEEILSDREAENHPD